MAFDVPHWQRFANLFRGLSRAHGVYELLRKKGGVKKVPGKAYTVRAPVTDELWTAHLEGRQGLGIVPIDDSGHCWFGAIDVDRYDLNLAEVETRCATLGLPLLPTRTKSGGVHLYAFGAEPLVAGTLKAKLEEWSVALGYGGSEVFPKQSELLNDKDVGNWINMPYFASARSETERYGIWKGKVLSLEEFCDRAEKLRITEEQLETIELAPLEEFLEGPPCLQSLGNRGFGEGQRNSGMTAVIVYLKKRFPDDWKGRAMEYNRKFFKPPMSESELNGIVKSMARKEYTYSCDTAPCKQFCNRNLCVTREFGIGKGEKDWNIVIDSDVQMIKSSPPYWIMNVNTVRMQFFSKELMVQRDFQDKCMEYLRYWPPTLPLDKWRGIVNKILTDAVEIEAPPDSGSAGELAYYLHQFCNPDAHPHGETRAEILTGKPYTEEGWVYFRSADFKRYLDAQHFRAFTGAKLFAELRRLGVDHKQLKVDTVNVQVWCVKAFDHSAPHVAARKVDQGGM